MIATTGVMPLRCLNESCYVKGQWPTAVKEIRHLTTALPPLLFDGQISLDHEALSVHHGLSPFAFDVVGAWRLPDQEQRFDLALTVNGRVCIWRRVFRSYYQWHALEDFEGMCGCTAEDVALRLFSMYSLLRIAS